MPCHPGSWAQRCSAWWSPTCAPTTSCWGGGPPSLPRALCSAAVWGLSSSESGCLPGCGSCCRPTSRVSCSSASLQGCTELAAILRTSMSVSDARTPVTVHAKEHQALCDLPWVAIPTDTKHLVLFTASRLLEAISWPLPSAPVRLACCNVTPVCRPMAAYVPGLHPGDAPGHDDSHVPAALHRPGTPLQPTCWLQMLRVVTCLLPGGDRPGLPPGSGT